METRLYESRFIRETDLIIELSGTKNNYSWSPELFGHYGWNLKVADTIGFNQFMLKEGSEFSLCKKGGNVIFNAYGEDFIISDIMCKTLMDNSVKL